MRPDEYLDLIDRLSDTWKASLLVDLALVSLMVDKGLITADEAVARIEGLYNKVDGLQSDGVLRRIEPLLIELRARPGAQG